MITITPLFDNMYSKPIPSFPSKQQITKRNIINPISQIKANTTRKLRNPPMEGIRNNVR